MRRIPVEYAAGFFDGEGYVGVVRYQRNGAMCLRCTVTNNNRPVLEMFRTTFGGSIRRPDGPGDGGKRSWVWCLTSGAAVAFLSAIAPHVVVKQPQVEAALTYPLGALGRRVSADDRAKRLDLYYRLKGLKTEVRTEDPDRRLAARVKLEERADVQRAVGLYLGGSTVHQVAAEIRRKYSTVSYWLTSLGVTRPRVQALAIARKRRPGLQSRPEVQRAIEIYATGKSAWATARDLGLGAATVNYWLRELGLTRSLTAAQRLRRHPEGV
jgi:transposase